MTKKTRKNQVKRCIMSNKPLTNGKEFVIVDFAVDYVKKQGYIVTEIKTIALWIMLICSLGLIAVMSNNVSAVSLDNSQIPKIIFEEGVNSLTPNDNCIILSDDTGDIFISFNLSCAGNGTNVTGGDFSFSDFQGSFDLNFSAKTTDNLTEGSINKYDNESWNESLADDKYYPLSNPYNFLNVSDSPFTNTSTQILIKSGYPNVITLISQILAFDSGSYLSVSDRAFCSNLLSVVCLRFNHTSAQYEFTNIAGNRFFTGNVVTGLWRFYNNLQIDGDLNLVGNFNKNQSIYFQPSRSSGSWANGTYAYFFTGQNINNFGANETGKEDRGVFYEGGGVIKEIDIRWAQATVSIPAPDIDYQIGYRNGTNFVVLFNQTYINLNSATFYEFQYFPNITIPVLADPKLITRVFTITEPGMGSGGSFLSAEVGIKIDRKLT